MSETNQNASENQNSTPASRVEQLDVLDQLLKPEVQESLTTLVESLPKLTEVVTLLTKSYDFFQSVATDEVLINDFKGGFQEFLKPIEHKAKDLAATAIEAKDAAEQSHETIGLFGLLRLLKDPQIQKLFRFVQAYLRISAEKENN
ncbi:hypothetical protein GCM10011391_14950 [Pullulanibacillus camelliae]|uniref:DUF1641 domain-containing protein n=1 Tax=Pullulanibacillus camelliae TaxID=1707096 RepID=A0A8J2VW12_9BACL|nr:DUF1641 domain-containing protein [Pullulanibacillus camelliae]GGE37075.1 hypothetical protein GCM10011391_14950 [Pullulanibacillus camelliae]